MNSWILFFLAVGVAVLLLYVPGFCFLKILNARSQASLVLAPAFSLLLLVLLGLIFYQINIPFEALTLLVAVVAACVSFILIAFFLHKNQNGELFLDWNISWGHIALYLLMGLLFCASIFIFPIDGAESFSDSYDNAFHLSLVKSFLDSKTASTLHAGVFPNKIADASFYPAAWHVLATSVACLFDGRVTLAANAVNAVICAFIIPMSWLALLSRLFKDDHKIILIGSFVCLSFNAYPWGFLIWGQILPNLLAFALVPAGMAIICELLTYNLQSKLKLSVLTLLIFACIAVTQPNGAFTLGIFLLPLLTKWTLNLIDTHVQEGHYVKKAIAVIALYALVAAVWYACYKAPFMQGTVQYEWKTDNTLCDAMLNGLGFSFGPTQEPQYLLACFVIIGIVAALLRRDFIGSSLVVLFFFVAFLQVVAATNYGVLKHLLTGFWYTDYYRVGAMQAMVAVPLLCLGIKQVLAILFKFIQDKRLRAVSTAAFVGIFAFVALSASVAFSYTRSQIAREYNYNCDFGLDSDEKAFIEEAKQIVGESAIFNMPFDGSRFLYATNGLNVLCRTSNSSGMATALDEPLGDPSFMAMHLKEIITNSEVAEWASALGAEYVLLLDVNWPSEGSIDSILYDADLWAGIQGIDENTPGFELVLAQGDMRLYRINV